MDILKSKITVGLIVMLLGVSYVGALDNNHFEENDEKSVVVNV